MINYEGDDIAIEEMPQGCMIHDNRYAIKRHLVTVASIKDAEALIDSLQRMVSIQKERLGEETDG